MFFKFQDLFGKLPWDLRLYGVPCSHLFISMFLLLPMMIQLVISKTLIVTARNKWTVCVAATIAAFPFHPNQEVVAVPLIRIVESVAKLPVSVVIAG